MKTTIDIPKELVQSAKIQAVRNGTSLKEMVIRGLREQVNRQGAITPKRTRKKEDVQAFLANIDAIASEIEAKSVTKKTLTELLHEGRR